MEPLKNSKRDNLSEVEVDDWDAESWRVPVHALRKGSKRLLIGIAAAGVFATVVLWQKQNRTKKLD